MRTDHLVLVRVLGATAGRNLSGHTLAALGSKGVNVNCVTSFLDKDGHDNLCFAIGADDLDQALGIIQSQEDCLDGGHVDYRRRCCAISIYGPHFAERPAIAGRVFGSVQEEGVEVLLISTSFSTVSFVTLEAHADKAVAALNRIFLVP
ncbi:hypothetical protein CSB20_01140 [bacterium DOLZORAL124_64_63]|nr:MAG: hypothetical protein CSB20_01140 [bacterium DOLZORAL124_64_63]